MDFVVIFKAGIWIGYVSGRIDDPLAPAFTVFADFGPFWHLQDTPVEPPLFGLPVMRISAVPS